MTFRPVNPLLTHTHLSTVPELNLDYIVDNPWIVIPISALRVINVDQVVQWLIKQGKTSR